MHSTLFIESLRECKELTESLASKLDKVESDVPKITAESIVAAQNLNSKYSCPLCSTKNVLDVIEELDSHLRDEHDLEISVKLLKAAKEIENMKIRLDFKTNNFYAEIFRSFNESIKVFCLIFI